MIVIDASAVLDLVFNRHSAAIVRERLLAPREIACAPHLIDAEVVQVLRRYVRTRELDAGRADTALADYLDLPIERYPHELFLPRVWEMKANFTAYDALYVALAEALEAPLLTSDAALGRAASKFVEVVVV